MHYNNETLLKLAKEGDEFKIDCFLKEMETYKTVKEIRNFLNYTLNKIIDNNEDIDIEFKVTPFIWDNFEEDYFCADLIKIEGEETRTLRLSNITPTLFGKDDPEEEKKKEYFYRSFSFNELPIQTLFEILDKLREYSRFDEDFHKSEKPWVKLYNNTVDYYNKKEKKS